MAAKNRKMIKEEEEEQEQEKRNLIHIECQTISLS